MCTKWRQLIPQQLQAIIIHGTSSEQREKNQKVITMFPDHIRVKFLVLQLNSRYRKTTPRADLSLSAVDVMQCLTF